MEKLIYFYVVFLGRAICKFLFHLELVGKENLRDIEGACIIAANHQSYLDPPVLGMGIPVKLRYFAKASLFRLPVVGFLVRNLGAVPIDRDIRFSITLRQGLKILNEKNWLVIFPEGTRSKTSTMLPPQKGIGFLHCKSKAPVVPIWIEGTGRALPVGAKILRPVKIKIIIGERMSVGENDYSAVAREVVRAIQKLNPA